MLALALAHGANGQAAPAKRAATTAKLLLDFPYSDTCDLRPLYDEISRNYKIQ